MEETPTAPAPAPAGESVWEKIPLTDGKYEVSSDGKIARILKSGSRRILKPYCNKTPYLAVKVFDSDGTVHNKYVHRIVAEVFLPKSDGHFEVNHIDGNKSNNCVDNLEWVTHSENNLHRARKLGKNHGGFPSVRLVSDNGVVYSSIRAAADALSVSTTTIRRHLDGYTKAVKNIKLRKEIV